MRTKSYLMITRNSVMAGLAYRAHYFFTLGGTAVFLAVSYFLWRAIYASGGTINGMSFTQAFLYVGVSAGLYGLMQTWTDWYMHQMITNGDLIRFLCKPIDFPVQLLFDCLGGGIMNFAGIALPSFIIVYLIGGAPAPSVVSMLAFLPAIVMGFLLNFFFDFLVGLSVFLTQSIWGIATAKEVTVLFLSGAAVPLAFFPAGIRRVLEWLPFQAVYNTPVRLLTDPTLGGGDILAFFLKQAAWLLFFYLLGRILFSAALRRVVVNGG
jgi:ABC-2 type transport system permease protein